MERMGDVFLYFTYAKLKKIMLLQNCEKRYDYFNS